MNNTKFSNLACFDGQNQTDGMPLKFGAVIPHGWIVGAHNPWLNWAISNHTKEGEGENEAIHTSRHQTLIKLYFGSCQSLIEAVSSYSSWVPLIAMHK